MRRHTPLIKKAPVTWILVADGRRAQIYTRAIEEKRVPLAGNARHHHYDDAFIKELVLVPGMEFRAASVENYEIDRNQLGRVFESASSAHHMSESHVDIHEEIKRRFMKSIAQRLNEAMAKKSFDKLVLIAPPKMLGELRECLGKSLAKRVVAELPKDLTHYDNDKLLQHLQNSGLSGA